MNKFQFILLSVLEKNNACNKISSMSSYDIQLEIVDLNYTTNYIRRTLNAFQKEGLVEIGLYDRRSVTYYLTQKGKEILNNLKNN